MPLVAEIRRFRWDFSRLWLAERLLSGPAREINMILGWPKGSGELLQVTSSLLRTSWAPFAPDAPHCLLG